MPDAYAHFRNVRFSTDDLPEHDRLPMWHEEFARTLVQVEINALSDEPLRAEAVARALPGFGMLSFRGSSMSFNRTRNMASAGDGSIGLIISAGTASTLFQRDHELLLDEGCGSLVLSEEPGRLIGRRHFGMVFPKSALNARIKNIEDAAMLPISSQSEPLRLLIAYVNALPDGIAFDDPKLRNAVLDHIYDLAAMAIDPNYASDGGETAVSTARLHAALDYIDRHFAAPGLTVSGVARAQGISTRYLQRLVASTGRSVNEHITERRLQRALVLLTGEEGAMLRISDVALRAGFSDVSNFNRLFRRRFGHAPTNFRRQTRR